MTLGTRWPAEPGGPVLPGRPGKPGTPSVPGSPCQIKTLESVLKIKILIKKIYILNNKLQRHTNTTALLVVSIQHLNITLIVYTEFKEDSTRELI